MSLQTYAWLTLLFPLGGMVVMGLRGRGGSLTPRTRRPSPLVIAAAGAASALAWAAVEPLDRRVFRCDYSDVELVGFGSRRLGFAVHAANGALFGLGFDAVRRRTSIDRRRLAVALALGEHAALWPLLLLIDRKVATSPRAFAQGTFRHALFGLVLGRLA